jgi:hypothetical protein
MDSKELRKLLRQLHDEVEKKQVVDEKDGELLRDIEGELCTLLERSEENPVQLHGSFIQRLEGALDHFEITHPDLTMLISKLLDSLSNAGI